MIDREDDPTVADQMHAASPLPRMPNNSEVSFIDGCRQAFANLSFPRFNPTPHDRLLRKHVGESAITRVSSVAPGRAIPSEVRLPEHNFKILWQLGGSSGFHGSKVSADVNAGDAIILPVTASYELTISADYDILTLMFDIRRYPEWRLVLDTLKNRPLAINSALRASGTVIQSLLRDHNHDPLEPLAVESAIDLFLRSVSLNAGMDLSEHQRLSPRLRRAKAAIMSNIANPDYSPEQLAYHVGLSKRSLYAEFQRFGLSPSAFIRNLRLQKCRSDILSSKEPRLNITQIAFQNGFSDSSQFSRAFRARYGMSPNQLRLTL